MQAEKWPFRTKSKMTLFKKTLSVCRFCRCSWILTKPFFEWMVGYSHFQLFSLISDQHGTVKTAIPVLNVRDFQLFNYGSIRWMPHGIFLSVRTLLTSFLAPITSKLSISLMSMFQSSKMCYFLMKIEWFRITSHFDKRMWFM